MEEITINIDGKEHTVKVEETEEGKILVHSNGDVFEIDPGKSKEAAIFDILKKKESEKLGSGTVTAPMPGTVYDVKVQQGQNVKEGDSLLTLIAMKMENNITAPKAGTIKEIKVKKNDIVNKGDVLVVIE